MKKQIFSRLALLAVAAAVWGLLLGWAATLLAVPFFGLFAGGAALLALLLGLASAVSSWIVRRVLRPMEEFSEHPDRDGPVEREQSYPELSPFFDKIRGRQQALLRQIGELTEERDALRVITGNMRRELRRQQQEFSSNADRLRVPLTVLSSLGERMEIAALSTEEAKGLGEDVIRESSRMSALLDDMIRLSRLDGESPAMTKVSLTAVCRETLTSLSLMAHKRGVGLKLTGPEVWAKGDAGLLGELMTALCENAIQYNHRDGSVLVETGSGADGTVWVTVRDTGVGIPEDSFQRIFDRFYQLGEGRDQQNTGTGLGLSIAKRLADFHQGGITLESTPGEGSVFTVTLPAWREETAHREIPSAKEPVAAG